MKHIFVQTLHAVYMSNFIHINLDLGISKREETEAKHNRLLVCAERATVCNMLAESNVYACYVDIVSEKACCQVSCSCTACDWTTGRITTPVS